MNNTITLNKIYPSFHPSGEGINWDKNITDDFTFIEWWESVKAMDDEFSELLYNGFPIAKNIIQAPQIVRDFTKEPVKLGSSYRTPRWEMHRGRSTKGDHPKGKGVDINGKNVVETLITAINTKNELYRKLRSIGINAFGVYDWGFHLGTRIEKPTGEIYFWDQRKKKE
ncbi:hypothetical protein [uncultured Tenacibaculum sp.]|uniref:hypothetical protein n=1 Tax=uncultured Tenacibaculum sp. TaxID=174713 RepID=UPI0026361806|nr:hypothetical protein [uncultured Tenacibaculum sp.]